MGLAAWNTLASFFNLIGATVESVLARVKLSNDELLVLICVAHAGDALSIGAIERATLLPAGRLRRALDELDARRLIAWSRSGIDRRKVLVQTTKAGRRLFDTLAPTMFDLIRGVVEPLSIESMEFMRAKLRKMIWSAAADAEIGLARMYAGQTYDGALAEMRSAQRPPTWGLAGWLRCCQWSGHVDSLWRRELRHLNLKAPRLQVLVALSRVSEGIRADALGTASATGLPQEVITSTLSALERSGLIVALQDQPRAGTRILTLTERGVQKVIEVLPIANRVAEDLFQGLGDEDLVRVLSLLPRLCAGAWATRERYGTAQPPTRTLSR
jgi:DNA-binding MarR family transcriptional regulator